MKDWTDSNKHKVEDEENERAHQGGNLLHHRSTVDLGDNNSNAFFFDQVTRQTFQADAALKQTTIGGGPGHRLSMDVGLPLFFKNSKSILVDDTASGLSTYDRRVSVVGGLIRERTMQAFRQGKNASKGINQK